MESQGESYTPVSVESDKYTETGSLTEAKKGFKGYQKSTTS